VSPARHRALVGSSRANEQTCGEQVRNLHTRVQQLQTRCANLADHGAELAAPRAAEIADIRDLLAHVFARDAPGQRKAVIEPTSPIRIQATRSSLCSNCPAQPTVAQAPARPTGSMSNRIAQWRGRWGGCDSNPRPKDYQHSRRERRADLRRRRSPGRRDASNTRLLPRPAELGCLPAVPSVQSTPATPPCRRGLAVLPAMLRTLDLVADPQVARRVRLALDMYEFGEQVQRSRLRRCYPGATADEIEARLRAWRRSRPGAAGGDAVGRPSQRFR
jgi:hypothetical protein